MRALALILGLLSTLVASRACIWDAESLAHEKTRSHDLAAVILGQPEPAEDASKLPARIKELEADRNETSADWWNNLAGAYLRLNQPENAAKLLEPVVGKFPDDYGIHANLGTAYHLLGRYPEAEKEIARDLEINPEAHFGLEKYHLALLQYLMRDADYKMRHLYVDEFTVSFYESRGSFLMNSESGLHTNSDINAESIRTNAAAVRVEWEHSKTNGDFDESINLLGQLVTWDREPAYREKWNLGDDRNLEAGVIYMAQMNPNEPACFTMLGIVAWKNHEYNLANSAFAKAISLGSPQSELLKRNVENIQKYIQKSIASNYDTRAAFIMGLFSLVSIIFLLCLLGRVLFKILKRRKI